MRILSESDNEKLNEPGDEKLETSDIDDDALLSSLMDDIPEELIEELSEQMQVFSENELNQSDVINKLASSEDLMGESNHLDSLLEAALEQEANADNDSEIGNLDTGFINDISVYDNEKRENADFIEMEELSEADLFAPDSEENQGVLNILSGIIPIAVIVVLVLFIIVLGMSFIMLLGRLPASPEPVQNVMDRPVFSPPEAVPNNQNFVFLGLETEFKGETIILEKMIVDQASTVFHFDKEFDILSTSFTLTDNVGRLYNRDLSFSAADMVQASGSVARFEPLIGRGSVFTLTVRDRILNETAVFEFGLERLSPFPPARYVNMPIVLEGSPIGVGVTLENAVFSSSGTIMNFTISWSDDIANILIDQEPHNLPGISLSSPTRAVLPSRRIPVLYHFPEYRTTLLRMDFAPVDNLTGEMSVRFNNLFESIPINEAIPMAGLFTNIEDEWVHVPASNFTAVLERMGRIRENYILVMHTLDRDGNVVESIPDASLMLTLRDGISVALDASSRSGSFGTDVIFNTPQHFVNEIRGVAPGNISLDLRGLLVRLNDVSSPVNLLADAEAGLSSEADIAKTSIISSFTQRLRYKSSIIPRTQIVGFTEDILNDEMLMRNYTPVPISAYESVMYAAQIVSYALIENDTLLAVVNETWQLERRNSSVSEFNRTHRVVARNIGGNWLIVSDEIIR